MKENDMEEEAVVKAYRSREDHWSKGFHIDRSGVRHKIKDMDTQYLRHVINLYKDRCNVELLVQEVFIRGL